MTGCGTFKQQTTERTTVKPCKRQVKQCYSTPLGIKEAEKIKTKSFPGKKKA